MDKIGENEKFLRASKDFQKLGEGKRKRRLLKEAQIKDGRLTELTANYFQRQEERNKNIQNKLNSIEEVNFDRPVGMSDEEYTRKIVEMEAKKSGILPPSPRLNIKPTGKVDPNFYKIKPITSASYSENIPSRINRTPNLIRDNEEKSYATPLLILGFSLLFGILLIANWEYLELEEFFYIYFVVFLLIFGIIFIIYDLNEKAREEGSLEERKTNPDLNTNDPNLHSFRLSQFQRSKYNWTTYYMGKKGGIYTVSYKGNKVYKHR